MIKVRQTRGSEALRQLALDGDVLDLVAQKFVVNVAGHGCLIDSKSFQGALHPVRIQTLLFLSMLTASFIYLKIVSINIKKCS